MTDDAAAPSGWGLTAVLQFPPREHAMAEIIAIVLQLEAEALLRTAEHGLRLVMQSRSDTPDALFWNRMKVVHACTARVLHAGDRL